LSFWIAAIAGLIHNPAVALRAGMLCFVGKSRIPIPPTAQSHHINKFENPASRRTASDFL
jgi:hypothetical protein